MSQTRRAGLHAAIVPLLAEHGMYLVPVDVGAAHTVLGFLKAT